MFCGWFVIHKVSAQTTYVTISGQMVTKDAAGQWHVVQDHLGTSEDSLGMLQVALNPLVKPEIEKHQYEDYQLHNIAKVRQVSLERELVAFGNYMEEKHALEEILIKISSAEALQDKTLVEKLTVLGKEQKKLLSQRQSSYEKAGNLALSTLELDKLPPKKLDSQVEKMSNELNITELKYGSSNPKPEKSSDTKMADLPIIMRDECAIETTFDGNKKIYATQSLPWFMYTPDKLKSYFKDRSLLQSSVYLTKDKSETLLHLVIKILSKDAAKNYGSILRDGMMSVQYVNGATTYLYAREDSESETENYTGNVIYNITYALPKSEIDRLESSPIDFIGLMWTSGFEKYTIYNVDVLMNEIKCLNKI